MSAFSKMENNYITLFEDQSMQNFMLQAVISDQKALKYEPSAIKRQHVASIKAKF
jgi:hypothetical protein